MYFNRREYLELINMVDKVSEGLKTALSKAYGERESEIAELSGTSKEQSIIYSIFSNSYDPRFGQTLIAYVDKHKLFNTDVFQENMQSIFGEYKILEKEDYKDNKATTYQKIL